MEDARKKEEAPAPYEVDVLDSYTVAARSRSCHSSCDGRSKEEKEEA